MKAARENEGSVPTRGTGNYSSDEAKEIARLKRELRDTKDALEILKKQSVSWEITEAIYTATSEYTTEVAELPQKHRVSVSGVLKILGVSRSGYRAWKQRVPSVSEKHRDHIKDAIKQIYDGSHQNYGAPKITEMLHRQGESIAEKR